MELKATRKTFAGTVYSLIAAGEEGNETLYIRIVHGQGESLDLELDVQDGRVIAESLLVHQR